MNRSGVAGNSRCWFLRSQWRQWLSQRDATGLTRGRSWLSERPLGPDRFSNTTGAEFVASCKHCPHPLDDHTAGLRCRVCGSECGIDCWTPGLIREHIEKGYVLPHDWRERLKAAGYTVAPSG